MDADATEWLPLRWDNFAWCFAHHGNAARAAREAGFSPRSAAAGRLRDAAGEPQVVARCFWYVALLRADGQPPPPEVARRLGDIGKARRLRRRRRRGATPTTCRRWTRGSRRSAATRG